MKIRHLYISKYNWILAQLQLRGQNQTWPQFYLNMSDCSSVGLCLAHCLFLNTQIHQEGGRCESGEPIAASTLWHTTWTQTQVAGREIGGHQGPLVLVKQPSTPKQSQQPSKCMSAQQPLRSRRQAPSFRGSSVQVMATSLPRDGASLPQGQPLREGQKGVDGKEYPKKST